jgi:hypothetical protein
MLLSTPRLVSSSTLTGGIILGDTEVRGDFTITGDLTVQGTTSAVVDIATTGDVTLGDTSGDTITVNGTTTLSEVVSINRTSNDLTLQTTTSGDIILSPAGTVTVGTISSGTWQGTAVDGTYVDLEGAEVKSTGEGGGSKYLREDGDGTCSWQVVVDGVTSVCGATGAVGYGDIDHDQLTNFASDEHYTQANITETGTIASGVWQGTSIGTSYTDAKVTSVSGSTGAVVDGDIDHDALANFASNEHFTQANITATGTVASGTWQGTAIDGTYIDLEGTEVKSTGEGGGTKYLREDGDGTCSWQAVTGGGGGSSLGTDSIIRTNLKTIDENITFAGNENGSTVGPITISSGYTVTVTSGSTWTII